MLLNAAKYAVIGSFERANSLAPFVGGILIYLAMLSLGLPMAIPSDLGGTLLLVLATFGAAWLCVVTFRFLYWPWKRLAERPQGEKPGATIEWHIYADPRPPKFLSGPDSWRMYYRLTTLHEVNPLGEARERVMLTTLFFLFSAPVSGTSFDITSTDMNLPVWQIKYFCRWGAIVEIQGQMPSGTLALRLI
jgi:hypothetical protein